MYAGIACGPQCSQELRVVRRGLEESCARLAGKGWLSSPEPQNESARLLGALAGQSRSKATAAPPSSDDGRYVQHGKRRYLSSLPSATSHGSQFVEYRRSARR